jgi:hypothetical protein
MADTKHDAASSIPVEGDGVSYSGILWFVVILTVTTLVCQALMWGLFAVLRDREASQDLARSPLAVPQGQAPPGPNLLAMLPNAHGEPAALKDFRAHEEATLNSFGWVDQNAGTIRIPIDRAKELLLQRGLPTRGETGK